MHGIDIAIIAAYLVLMVFVGWWVSKLAARSAESYFLAGKQLPWWVIGIAHGSSGVDITGTMWFVTMEPAQKLNGALPTKELQPLRPIAFVQTEGVDFSKEARGGPFSSRSRSEGRLEGGVLAEIR
ncbi:MAG: hypothetical protein JXP34_03750 [Planctomycetes bacterium]|nr:hypothetical protein [Planctomycetota bacterium]